MSSEEQLERSAQSIDRALGEIEHSLEQMLALARLSASDLNLDREALQKDERAAQQEGSAVCADLQAPGLSGG